MACPMCGEEGQRYTGPPRAAAYFFAARTIFDMHELRRALDAAGKRDRAQIVSALIREIESLMEETRPGDD